MKFLLHENAGEAQIAVSGEDYKYLIKVRRHKSGDLILVRSPKRLEIECRYRIDRIEGRSAVMVLENQRESRCEGRSKLHIGWCLVDPKTVEKTLPMLTEMGVKKITFIHCRRSQHNFRLDFERLERIMESAIMQCGRTSLVELSECTMLSRFLEDHPDAAILDFGGEPFEENNSFDTVVIGCEGGFDDGERKLFSSHPLFSFSSPMVLRSETAVVSVAARYL